jgi:hypothetical protein
VVKELLTRKKFTVALYNACSSKSLRHAAKVYATHCNSVGVSVTTVCVCVCVCARRPPRTCSRRGEGGSIGSALGAMGAARRSSIDRAGAAIMTPKTSGRREAISLVSDSDSTLPQAAAHRSSIREGNDYHCDKIQQQQTRQNKTQDTRKTKDTKDTGQDTSYQRSAGGGTNPALIFACIPAAVSGGASGNRPW